MSANSLSSKALAFDPSTFYSPDCSRLEQCVHDMVRTQALSMPDAIALVRGNESLSYGELNSRTETLAYRLRSLGVGPDVPVGLCMERSVELPIAALAILKAGGAYVPLDPTYPSRRLSLQLEDSETPLVIANSATAAKLPCGKWETLVLNVDELESANDPASSPARTVTSHNLAYIIFTSGSTGRPKGVKISHGNLLNLVRWHQRAFKVTPSDRATLQSSPGFDAAVWEIWPYLASGASLHVVDETVRTTPEVLREWIVGSGITISFLPTMLAESMIALKWPQNGRFRLLLTGADTLRQRPPQDLPFDLINNYGPTECTVVATSGRVPPSDKQSVELPSIGWPIDNVSIHIVDKNLQPVPEGTAGELLIGGLGVGQGYLNSPEQSAERFLPDTLSEEPGARLYRTGDLARRLPDGQIAYLGRLDDQIKVMGYRIEPNEVISVLNRHPQVKTSFVCSLADASSNKQLVAYIVPATDVLPKPGDLRDFLSSQLPSHTVPSAFVKLGHLPLSAHGKIDRSALPQPTPENVLRDELGEEPQSPIEKHLTGLVSCLLAVPVGREDNFFTLGGHSLMGAQLISKIRESFGVDLTLRNLFEEPTVRGMSEEIEKLIHARVATMSEDEVQHLLTSSGGM